MDYPELVPGTLLRRYKRFLADVELTDGRVVVAHCPNTGSMRAVNVPGCRVWLSASDNPKRKLAWTWELIELPQEDGRLALASVQTGRANALVEEALQDGMITELAGFATLRREVAIAGSRLDFRLTAQSGAETYVEVKQVTLKETDGHGYFPDAVSVRGRKHLEVLAQLAAEGKRAVLLFCVAHEGIDAVAPAAHLDPAYAAALIEAAECGVEVLAYGCTVTRQAGIPQSIRLMRPLSAALRRIFAEAQGSTIDDSV